jgi:hypothetical protein
MSRKFNSVSAILALTVLVLAASSAMAQDDRAQPTGPTLGCCKCLGGSNALDLSTISSNPWTVNSNPVVFLAQNQINSAWNINPGPAQWVSTSAGGGNGAAGNFDYKLSFMIPECTIRQQVTLSGSYGGDNNVALYLDSVIPANLIAQCTGNWCFSTSHQPLPTFTKAVGPGPHALIVRVNNQGGPQGMFINARLSGACAR